MHSDPLSLLAAPGGQGSLRRDGDALVSDDGRRFPIEKGIIRMLEGVDEGLASELDAQKAAMSIYLDEGYLITRYERLLARVAVEELLGQVTGPVLDAGCGIGLIGRRYPTIGLYGADASFPLLEQARTGYAVRIECNAERLPFKDRAFGAVLGLNVLHHVIHPEQAMAEFARVLEPNGILVALDPRKVPALEFVKRTLRKNDPAYADTHKAFGVDEYERLIRADGAFEIETVRRFGLLVLIGAGGLDQFGISRRLGGGGAVLDDLIRVDTLIERLPGFDQAGLYLGMRARRTATAHATSGNGAVTRDRAARTTLDRLPEMTR